MAHTATSSQTDATSERALISELITAHSEKIAERPARRRKSAQERFEEIIDVAVRLIGEKGYFGTSLPDIAHEIGISHTAVLHHIKNKQNLLIAIIERHYDRFDAMQNYLAQFNEDGEHYGEKACIPEVLRRVVAQNVEQPEMVKAFEILNTEAITPSHPAHAYFAQRPQKFKEQYRQYEWAVPEGVDGEFVFLLAFAAMYGLEERWLTNPESIDFIEEWARYEDYLFPLPQWEGCR